MARSEHGRVETPEVHIHRMATGGQHGSGQIMQDTWRMVPQYAMPWNSSGSSAISEPPSPSMGVQGYGTVDLWRISVPERNGGDHFN